MQNSLGIYIEKNMIKYDKLQKEKNDTNVALYGTIFYEDNKLKETIDRIVNETDSQRIPISVNLSDEAYNMFMIPSLLGPKDAKKAANIEFESLCNEQNLNKMLYEQKCLFTEDNADSENQRVLSIMVDKNNVKKISKNFEDYRLSTISPIPVSITNLIENKDNESCIIVNIEEQTYVTTILGGEIYQFDIISQGMGEILDYINKTENSFAKSYEVCKNLTIYAQDTQDIYSQENEYADSVRSIVYEITEQVKRIADKTFSTIGNVYITGAGTCINNIDLFFQEFITATKCQILKPEILNSNNSSQISLNEYIEVNSAIALALDGLGFVNKEVNFGSNPKMSLSLPSFGGGTSSLKSSLSSGLSKDIDLKSIQESLKKLGTKIASDFKAPVSSDEKLIIRGTAAAIITMVVFIIFSTVISSQIEDKTKQVDETISETNIQLGKIQSDISTISSRTTTYDNLITEMTAAPEEEEEETTDENAPRQRVITKDSIPNLLNRIMFVIPKRVKLNSIKNTTEKHIVINAEAEKYEQLGYFKAVLTTNGILQNVKSTSGEKTGSTVQVTIEGDLP